MADEGYDYSELVDGDADADADADDKFFIDLDTVMNVLDEDCDPSEEILCFAVIMKIEDLLRRLALPLMLSLMVFSSWILMMEVMKFATQKGKELQYVRCQPIRKQLEVLEDRLDTMVKPCLTDALRRRVLLYDF